MNIKKVGLGGLFAGLILIIVNVLAQLLLAERAQREMYAVIPDAAERLAIGAAALSAGIFMKIVIGIILAWLYAALRPRFGSGVRTAAIVTLIVWVLGGIFSSDLMFLGMMSGLTYFTIEVFQLLGLIFGTLVCAWIYTK